MEVSKGIEHCPFCDRNTDVGTIEIEGLISIKLCSECYACWEVFRGQNDKLIRSKYYSMGGKVIDRAETKDESLLCPICWRKLEEDWDEWVIKCPDPICGYRKRIPGLSREQREIKTQYTILRGEVFKLVSSGEEVPKELEEKYKDSQSKYNSLKRFDQEKV